MSDIELRKIYVRHKEQYPEADSMAWAHYGFSQLGIETVPFYWIDDIDSIEDLGPEVGIAGYVGDIHRALQKVNLPIPPNVDYPEALKKFIGRDIYQGTLKDVRKSIKPLFVKPVEHKVFSGFIYSGDDLSRRRIVTLDDDVPVWICEPVNIVAEYRSFILYNQLLDVRRYKGDWSVAPDKNVLEEAVKLMKGLPGTPKAYLLDWGIDDKGNTFLVEMNEGFSFGHYGFPPVSYARMISARWYEMTRSLKGK